MISYICRVVVEQDEDAWRAYIPALESRGGATWDTTREGALRNIHEVAQMVIESILQDGEALPADIAQVGAVVVAVTV